jgi:hypothetical protein
VLDFDQLGICSKESAEVAQEVGSGVSRKITHSTGIIVELHGIGSASKRRPQIYVGIVHVRRGVVGISSCVEGVKSETKALGNGSRAKDVRSSREAWKAIVDKVTNGGSVEAGEANFREVKFDGHNFPTIAGFNGSELNLVNSITVEGGGRNNSFSGDGRVGELRIYTG